MFKLRIYIYIYIYICFISICFIYCCAIFVVLFCFCYTFECEIEIHIWRDASLFSLFLSLVHTHWLANVFQCNHYLRTDYVRLLHQPLSIYMWRQCIHAGPARPGPARYLSHCLWHRASIVYCILLCIEKTTSLFIVERTILVIWPWNSLLLDSISITQ